MKVMTILGTRPEIIRLSGVIALLDRHARHVLVHTGQNYDARLSGIFFRELGVRRPDLELGVRSGTFAAQIGKILEGTERALLEERPDRLLILGDTNSGLSAVIARRLGVPVYHMEAGNRCHDDRVPEEVNRRVIDHSSSVLLPYTNRSRENLIREGIPGERVLVTGNPIKDVIDRFAPAIKRSTALRRLGLQEGRYFLVTMHRAENVDVLPRLRSLLAALRRLHKIYGHPVVCSLHPRTRSRIRASGLRTDLRGLLFVRPLGFRDFVRLERSAFCILSDSGTVQEEACILGTPNVTVRDTTERPETLECGSNILAGVDPDEITRAVEFVLGNRRSWTVPPEYLASGVAETVCRILLGHREADAAELEWRSGARR
ncbi:MAG: UDP-N-acetylglucosamine 2-epimerase (non-hydrolyzing) [Deltaproteobacteria bacterium]|nr:UDP-N-acetylglucosamine 2-epimerase (non-hydrolyzing) [Deltaproteobacteria bacterium]